MKSAQFNATIVSGHKEDAVEVPFDPAERWGSVARSLRPGRRGHAVRGTLGKTPFESAIVARSRRFWLLLPAALEDRAGVTSGDEVHISISPAAPGAPGKSRAKSSTIPVRPLRRVRSVKRAR